MTQDSANQTTLSRDVFVSYASHDAPPAQKVTKPAAVANIADTSIAVLPFVDMSEKKDQEHFADRMAEEIIDLLVKFPQLKVTSRTSLSLNRLA